jgi:hypothetical protein
MLFAQHGRLFNNLCNSGSARATFQFGAKTLQCFERCFPVNFDIAIRKVSNPAADAQS